MIPPIADSVEISVARNKDVSRAHAKQARATPIVMDIMLIYPRVPAIAGSAVLPVLGEYPVAVEVALLSAIISPQA